MYHAQQKSLYFSVSPLSSVTIPFKDLFKFAKDTFINFSCPQISGFRGPHCHNSKAKSCFLSKPFSIEDFKSITLHFKISAISPSYIRFGLVEFSDTIQYDEFLCLGCGFAGNGYVKDYGREFGDDRAYTMNSVWKNNLIT